MLSRSGFKRGIVTQASKRPLGRAKLRKQGKAPISKVQRHLWAIIKEVVRKRHPPYCYTCGAGPLVGSNCQTGHVPWPKSVLGAFLKYDFRVLRIQCFNCNIRRGGMGAEAYKRMLEEIGPEKMAQLEKDRQVSVNAYEHFTKLLEEYKKLNEQIKPINN